MNKILTIVIPTYNMEKYLDKCLTSLIVGDSELMKQLEVLVIIDGAKDRSSEIAHSYENRYPNTFRVIDKENGNYGSCINRGLAEVTGKYIKVLDADDSFDTTAFIGYLSTLSKLDVDLVLNDCSKVTSDNRVVDIWKFNIPKYKNMRFSNIYPQMHCVAYKTEILKTINYRQTEGISYTDQEWVFYPMTAVSSLYYIPVSLYRYLIGREGQTIDPSIYMTKGFAHECIITKRMMKFIMENNHIITYDYLICKLISRIQEQYAEILVNNGNNEFRELIMLDNYIKDNYSELYKLLENQCVLSAYVPMRFIKYWRNNNNYIPPYHPQVLLHKVIREIKHIRVKIKMFFR